MNNIEKLLASYMGENKKIAHPIENRYLELLSILPENRTYKQNMELGDLARALYEAVENEQKAFKETLDNYLTKKG